MKFKLFLLSLLVLFSTTNLFSQDKKLKVSFVSSHPDDTQFWYLAHNFARKAAKDLDIDFKIYYNEEKNRFSYLDAYKKAFSETNRPDFIIGVFAKGISTPVLKMSEEFGIPVFIVNTNTPESEKEFIGEIRTKHKNFIGHMAPDEKEAGYLLAKYLINKVKKNNPNKKVKIVGITGDRINPVSLDRKEGLENAAKDTGGLLYQVVFSDWTKKDSMKKTEALLKRYKNLDAFWYISAETSSGGNEILKKSDRDIVVGTFDWKKNIIKDIREKRCDATLGGHFVEIGFALVLLYDYYNGKDFYEEFSSKINTEMEILTAENIHLYYDFLTNEEWRNVDFKRYSKVLNKDLKKYDFSFKTLLEEQ